MMMTETEAKKKWCPFARQSSTGSTGRAGINRDGYDNPVGKCLGSACMAWKQHSAPPLRHFSITEKDGWGLIPKEESELGHDSWEEPENEWRARFWGFCGLAEKR